ncbi:MAG: hypothetical protein HC869_20080 [Rhodospirillales bacterium]|nr:hypothetical protein [Rhodospirillales bacterium]
MLCGALAACGNSGKLAPAAGQSLPPAAYGEAGKTTPEDLITPSAQAQPSRNDEILRRSEKREADPFDLPPPD